MSDERTEVFLRDQRRSKAHRALVPDAGAPCDEVLNVDLGAVDPLYMDETGAVRSVRDLAGKPVSQVLLGGDSGCTLRDLFAAAALLKSKRVPARVEFLVAIPSRQMLEVLAGSGALTDLIATGARLIEPDARVMTGELYPPAPGRPQRAHARSRAERHGAEERRHRLGRDARLRRRHRRDGRSAQLQAPGARHHPARAPDRRRPRRARSQGRARRRQEGRVARAPRRRRRGRATQTLDVVEGPAHLANGERRATTERRNSASPSSAPRSTRSASSRRAPWSSRRTSAPCSRRSSRAAPSRSSAASASRRSASTRPAPRASRVSARSRSRARRSGPRRSPRSWPSGAQKVPLTWLALGPERAWVSAGTVAPGAARARA